jgi:hypothetical protein
MRPEDAGLDSDERYVEARMVMRQMTATLVAATQTEPPHLVDVQVVNDQDVGLWYTIEPFNEMSEHNLQGWDVTRKRFVTFPLPKIVNVTINSRNYARATEEEWRQRQLLTNLRWDEDKQIRQSKGVFWRGKRTPRRHPRRVQVI